MGFKYLAKLLGRIMYIIGHGYNKTVNITINCDGYKTYNECLYAIEKMRKENDFDWYKIYFIDCDKLKLQLVTELVFRENNG